MPHKHMPSRLKQENKKKKSDIFSSHLNELENFGPENTDVHCILGKRWELEEWNPAKKQRQDNRHLLWYLCTDNRLCKISLPTWIWALRAAAAISPTLILQLHETVLIKGLFGWDSSPPTSHTFSTDIYIWGFSSWEREKEVLLSYSSSHFKVLLRKCQVSPDWGVLVLFHGTKKRS